MQCRRRTVNHRFMLISEKLYASGSGAVHHAEFLCLLSKHTCFSINTKLHACRFPSHKTSLLQHGIMLKLRTCSAG